MNVEEICAEARRFTREERGVLFRNLIDDLGRSDYEVSDQEVAQRVKETENGLVQDISHDELVAGLKYLPRS